MKPVLVQIDYLWDGLYLPIPSYEVQRCRLMHIPMFVQLLSKDRKDVINSYRIPLNRIKEFRRTGIKRDLFEHNRRTPSQHYEILLFTASEFIVPDHEPDAVGVG